MNSISQNGQDILNNKALIDKNKKETDEKIADNKKEIEKGLNFYSDKGGTNKKLGETLNIQDGKNIETEIKNGEVIISLNNNIEVEKIKTKKITGLADILADETDGSIATNKNYIDPRIFAMEQKLNIEISSDSALNAALAALKPLSYDPLRASQFTAGMGMYKVRTAFALGLNHYTSENTMINGGVSFASGTNINDRKDIMFNLGFTHKFGSKADIYKLAKEYQAGPISSVYVMQEQMQKVMQENEILKNKLKEQEEINKKQEEHNKKMQAQIEMLLQKIK